MGRPRGPETVTLEGGRVVAFGTDDACAAVTSRSRRRQMKNTHKISVHIFRGSKDIAGAVNHLLQTDSYVGFFVLHEKFASIGRHDYFYMVSMLEQYVSVFSHILTTCNTLLEMPDYLVQNHSNKTTPQRLQ